MSSKHENKKIIFIVFVILVGLSFVGATIYYLIESNGQNENISDVLASVLVSGLFGAMFFLPSYLTSEETYTLPTAFVNYFIMIMESTTMLIGFELYGKAIGSYGNVFVLLIYAFFGLHLFAYPKKFLKSLVQLAVPIVYMALNIMGLKFFSSTTLNSFDIFYKSLSQNGYLFTWGLIIGGFLVFSKFWYMSRYQNKFKEGLRSINNIKTLYIPFIIYTIFIFIPGVWYLSRGFENFFKIEGSLFFVLISIAYFASIIYFQGQNFSNQLEKLFSGKLQKKII